MITEVANCVVKIKKDPNTKDDVPWSNSETRYIKLELEKWISDGRKVMGPLNSILFSRNVIPNIKNYIPFIFLNILL